MLKLDLKQPIKNLAGSPMKDDSGKVIELGKTMANAIISVSSTNDAARNYILATKFYQDESYDFSAEELEYVKGQIKEAGAKPEQTGVVFPIIYKGQILEILSKLDKKDEEKETEQNKTEEEKS